MIPLLKKGICFNKTFYYFNKDKDIYNPCDCHTNTYINFYDRNYLEVEKREKDFKYVTGLLTYDNGQDKYCVVHSWVEDNGEIIDTTSLANSQLKILNSLPKEEINQIKNLLEEKIGYLPYSSLDNKQFTLKCQDIYSKCGYNQEKVIEYIKKYLISIAQSVEKDKRYLEEVKSKLGYEYKADGFQIEIK